MRNINFIAMKNGKVIVARWFSVLICGLIHYFLFLWKRPSAPLHEVIGRGALMWGIYPILWWIIAERILRLLERMFKNK